MAATSFSNASDATRSIDKALSEWNDLLYGGGEIPRQGGEGEAADGTQPDGERNDATGDWLSASEYRARLETFRAETYFAKPAEVSPLVCARFGWTNTARDILTCVHPSCRAAVCVSFHPVLSASSVQSLARKYRQMLATAHAPGGVCPFRSDAERWLLEEDAEGTEGFAVPPYLIPMSEEFVLLEDANMGGLVTRRLIRRAALQLSKQIAKTNSISLSLPREVKDFLGKECLDFTTTPEIIENFGAWIFDVLHIELQAIDLLEQDSSSRPRVLDGLFAGRDSAQREDSLNDSSARGQEEASLLASFGWRMPSNHLPTSAGGGFVVQCRVCLACASVALKEGDDDDGEVIRVPPTKKQRTADRAPSIPEIDLVSSHRHFCPYRCGFNPVKGGKGHPAVIRRTAKPGWKMILSMLIQHHRDKENDSGENESSGERTFKSVRHVLRSMLSPRRTGTKE